jgi:hypothetical protein
MTSFKSVTLEVADPAAADAFYKAFGLDPYVKVRASQAPTTRAEPSPRTPGCPRRALDRTGS